MNDTEKKYFLIILNDINEFPIFLENVNILGGTELTEEMKEMMYLNNIDTWTKNINYMIKNIKFSFLEAIRCMEALPDNYSVFRNSEEVQTVYYYTENVMFRLTILWDLLSQLNNTIFKHAKSIRQIHCKDYFETMAQDSNSNGHEFFEKVKDYLNEKEGNSDVNPWKGNHAFLKELRNSFTHRLNPHLVNFLNNPSGNNTSYRDALSLPTPPTYEMKRMIEDFNAVYKFIKELRETYIS